MKLKGIEGKLTTVKLELAQRTQEVHEHEVLLEQARTLQAENDNPNNPCIPSKTISISGKRSKDRVSKVGSKPNQPTVLPMDKTSKSMTSLHGRSSKKIASTSKSSRTRGVGVKKRAKKEKAAKTRDAGGVKKIQHEGNFVYGEGEQAVTEAEMEKTVKEVLREGEGYFHPTTTTFEENLTVRSGQSNDSIEQTNNHEAVEPNF